MARLSIAEGTLYLQTDFTVARVAPASRKAQQEGQGRPEIQFYFGLLKNSNGMIFDAHKSLVLRKRFERQAQFNAA
jgi:hypothetical protein